MNTEQVKAIIEYWMQDYPLKYVRRFRDRKLMSFTESLKEYNIKIVVYSDYPVTKKLDAVGLKTDYAFCSTDEGIQCLKPDPKGLRHILYALEESAENVLMIGDRYEKDGMCALTAGMDYLILHCFHCTRNMTYNSSPIWRNVKKV